MSDLHQIPRLPNRPSLSAAAHAAIDGILTAQPEDVSMVASMVADFAATSAAFSQFATRNRAVIFGSARIDQDSPVYAATRLLASRLVQEGFMVLTGGGPGVMAAGLEGAGPGNAIGVAIHLPFESPANVPQVPVVFQQRFFTRKLALLRFARAVVVLPGGFGTLDETFEVVTLLQTGKMGPTPVVLLDPLGNGFFEPLLHLVHHVAKSGFVDEYDQFLLNSADSVEGAISHVRHFWSNYVRFEFSDDVAMIELRHQISQTGLAKIAEMFHPFTPFSQASARSPANLTGTQLRFRFDRRNYGLLRRLIDVLNELP